ncbi:MAG TPA: hypothetical protein VFC68_04830, partial [Treponemataceae bacterium]|nr:hypothetical protein [Treponemataceae bacterium]
MKLKKITLLIFTAVFVSISCSSETEAGRAQKAFEKKDYGRVLKITGVPPLDDFKNWGSENYKFGSKARDPQKNNAELADENILLSQKNKKIELMLLSMQKVKDIRLSDYIAAWYEYFAITDIHIRFASYLRNTTDDTIIVIPAQTGNMIDFRLSCYKRLWTDAYRLLENNFVKTETTVFCLDRAPAFLIDATNSIIYGTSNRIEYASLLSNEANRINNKTTAFLFSFCSGKIYDKSGSEYRAQALEQFHYAMNSAQTPAHYDYALWYYLTLNKKNSLRDALDSTREYASTWFDSTWYDDFLDDISKTMLENQLWDTYYSMYTFILPYASDVINSKYAYIAGRLIQEQLIIHSKTTDNAIEQAFQTAWHSSDGQLYYRLMAADKLHISSKQILQELTHKNENWNIKADKNTIKTIENLFKTQNFESIHYIYT